VQLPTKDHYCLLIVMTLLVCLPVCAAQNSKPKDKPTAPIATCKPLSGANKDPTSCGSLPAADKDSASAGLKNADPNPQIDPNVYHIGVEDEIQISVWKEPELSVTVVVRPDGMISMPLINDISVVGLLPSELQVVLTEKLKPFVNEPQVTVIVRGIRSRKIYVFGNVVKAGTYTLVSSKTVLGLLAEAGGLTLFAKQGSIYVLRTVNGKRIKIPFNYKKALSGNNPKDNFELLPGDLVVVP
jgi:polysaccharide biosynthesis/export protein